MAGAWGAEVIEADICIYGGTAGGVAAAVQAARMGKKAVIAEPGRHLGGMTSGGLGATDIGNKAAIGGIAREFYQAIARHYARDEAWTFERRADYFRQQGGPAPRPELAPATQWTFEPHVAEDIFFRMVNEAKAPVYFQQRLAGVNKSGTRLSESVAEQWQGLSRQHVHRRHLRGGPHGQGRRQLRVGREANAQYRETLNGVRAETPKHQFLVAVDPYVTPGDAASGLLPFIQRGDGARPGEGDRCVQAYNFRLCYTQVPANRLPHARPAGYTPARYELLARYLEALVAAGHAPRLSEFWNPIPMPNAKTDINNNGGFSTDFIGANYDYPEAGYPEREKLWRAHEDYTRGLVYFLATSPRVPEKLRAEMQSWGPAKDEFLDTGGWPHQLYVREARRMVSDYVMTEHHCRGEVKAAEPVGLAAYTMDSHNCQRLARQGRAENEGDVQVGSVAPYPIARAAIVPKAAQCQNLLVPICLSATHIAYGSIRMEPVFMILGQSAATAAALALEENVPLQELDYAKLRARLLADKQILEWK